MHHQQLVSPGKVYNMRVSLRGADRQLAGNPPVRRVEEQRLLGTQAPVLPETLFQVIRHEIPVRRVPGARVLPGLGFGVTDIVPPPGDLVERVVDYERCDLVIAEVPSSEDDRTGGLATVFEDLVQGVHCRPCLLVGDSEVHLVRDFSFFLFHDTICLNGLWSLNWITA